MGLVTAARLLDDQPSETLGNKRMVLWQGAKVRDPEKLLAMLKSMSENESGVLFIVHTLDGADEGTFHHAELLEDTGHAELRNESALRITSEGSDFLSAVEHHEEARQKFLDLFNQGVDYSTAALNTVALVRKLMGLE